MFSRSLRCPLLPPIVLISIGLCACSKTDPNASVTPDKVKETAVATGGKQLTASGISLTFPSNWETVEMTQGQMDTALAPLAKQPRGQEMLQAAKAAYGTGLIKMMVFDPTGSKPGFMNNANLVVTRGGANATLDQILESSKQQVVTLGAKASTSKVTFPAGEFGRVESHLKDPGGHPYVAIGYVQAKGDEIDVVTFSCPEDQVGAFDAKAQAIMKSFKRS